MKEIPLSKGYVALVDDEDYERLRHFCWSASTRDHGVYATRRQGTATIYMHREILGLSGRLPFVDHVNRDGLDCQRRNLRTCTCAQNNMNVRAKSANGFKGVYPKKNRWIARIRVSHKHIYLGCFLTRDEAGLAYDEAAKQYFGEFAKLNFPNGLPAVAAAGEPNNEAVNADVLHALNVEHGEAKCPSTEHLEEFFA